MVNRYCRAGRPKKFRTISNLKKRKIVEEDDAHVKKPCTTHLVVSPEKQEEIVLSQTTAPPVSSNNENVAIVDNSPPVIKHMIQVNRTLPSRFCKEVISASKDRRVLKGPTSKQQSSGNRLVDLDSLVDMVGKNTVC